MLTLENRRTWLARCVPISLSCRRHWAAPVRFHFLENWLDMRDIGAANDHEESLPHPGKDQVQ
jgi:hypothetical protein